MTALPAMHNGRSCSIILGPSKTGKAVDSWMWTTRVSHVTGSTSSSTSGTGSKRMLALGTSASSISQTTPSLFEQLRVQGVQRRNGHRPRAALSNRLVRERNRKKTMLSGEMKEVATPKRVTSTRMVWRQRPPRSCASCAVPRGPRRWTAQQKCSVSPRS